MPRTRKNALLLLLAGLLSAVAFTFLGMLILCLLLVKTQMDSHALVWINQLLKVLAIVLGVCFAVPRGSENGLARGALLALAYMLLGYALYLVLGGSFSFGALLGELLLGCAAGAITGAVRANLSPAKRGKKRYIQS